MFIINVLCVVMMWSILHAGTVCTCKDGFSILFLFIYLTINPHNSFLQRVKSDKSLPSSDVLEMCVCVCVLCLKMSHTSKRKIILKLKIKYCWYYSITPCRLKDGNCFLHSEKQQRSLNSRSFTVRKSPKNFSNRRSYSSVLYQYI